jgi:hypothetical protein
MNPGTREPARYLSTDVPRYAHNAFIEALPRYPKRKLELVTCTANYPPEPTAKVRAMDEMIRIAELRAISDLRIPLAELQPASVALTLAMRESYVARNPLTVEDVRRRHELAAARNDAEFAAVSRNFKSKALAYLLIAVTGMGKTTYIEAFTGQYTQIIEHTKYRGSPLTCIQISYVILRCPHDGTLKSLCLQFFEEIDRLLGTTYKLQAIGLGSIALMVMLMHRVCYTVVSLGTLVIDEVQNLRAARGGTAELMLNLFSEIVEKIGITLVVLATPAVQKVIETGVRNIRKLTTVGDSVLAPVGPRTPLWTTFTDIHWGYTYTKKKKPLRKAVREAWWNASGGNHGLASLAFFLAQMDEIGEGEEVTELSFERVQKEQMAALQPAIAALKSRDPKALLRFDDLLFVDEYEAVRRDIWVGSEAPEGDPSDVFEEEIDAEAKATKKRSARRPQPSKRQQTPLKPHASAPKFRREDPLARAPGRPS